MTWGGARAGAGRKGEWRSGQTKAYKLPVVLAEQIIALAKALDAGQEVTIGSSRGAENLRLIAELESAQQQIANLTAQLTSFRNPLTGRQLEDAIAFLVNSTDGLNTGEEADYGHWLASQITANHPLPVQHAQTALRMLQGYAQKLAAAGIELPVPEALAHQYPKVAPDALPPGNPPYEVAIAPQRILPVESQGGFRIKVVFPFDEALMKKARSISGRHYDKETRATYYPLSRAQAIVEAFPDFAIDPRIHRLVDAKKGEAMRQGIELRLELPALCDAAKLDTPLSNGMTLFEHQKEGVGWLLGHRQSAAYRGGILADQMGLGKTLTSLVAAKAMKAVYNCHVFVVCPASVRDNWVREAEWVGVGIEVFSWAKVPQPLTTAKYVVIADEAHYMQSLDSARTKNMLHLAESPNCLAVWLLTGTPLKNGCPVNLYPLLKACKHPLAENQLQYEEYFCAAKTQKIREGKSVRDVTGAAHLDELSQKTNDVILRRTKKDCLDLPPKIRQTRVAEVSSAAKKQYKETLERLIEDYRQRVAAGITSSEAFALVHLGHLRRAGSMAKVESAIALAQEILEQDESVVVFTEFLESAEYLHEKLGGELLTGKTPQKDRQTIVDRFQEGESRVFVGTIQAGGIGLTLHASSTVILVDRPWTPGDAEQAEDRCHRIGQELPVTSVWLQYGNIDVAIDSLLQQKQDRIELVLKGKRKTLRGLDSPAALAQAILQLLSEDLIS